MIQLSNLSSINRYYLKIKENRWHRYFSILCRIALAFGFFVAGMVKIAGERFASGLSTRHPMGAYLEALYHTRFYYTFIGIAQVVAAILLLIPTTVVLGAVLYFPIIINIWLLSLAVRFEGSFVTSPLMVLANLYILFWNYDRVKYILPFKENPDRSLIASPTKYSNKFPFLFFSGVIITVGLIIATARFGFEAMPRNSLSDCKKQFVGTKNEAAGCKFCECIHNNGKPLDECLEEFENSIKKTHK